MLVSAAKLKREMCVSVEGLPYIVENSTRVKYGKGAAFIRADLRCAVSNVVRRFRFHPTQRLETIDLVVKQVQYLRSSGDQCIFSDVTSLEEIAIPFELLGEDAQWFEEGDRWDALYLNGEFLAAHPWVTKGLSCGRALVEASMPRKANPISSTRSDSLTQRKGRYNGHVQEQSVSRQQLEDM